MRTADLLPFRCHGGEPTPDLHRVGNRAGHDTHSHEGDSNTYRGSLSDDCSAWQEQDDVCADEGILEEVFQRALYMTADFHRTP